MCNQDLLKKNHLCLLNLIYIEEYRIQRLYSSLVIAFSILRIFLILRVIYMVKRMATEQVNEKIIECLILPLIYRIVQNGMHFVH